MNRFEWDEHTYAAKAAKHGIWFEDVVGVFDDPVRWNGWMSGGNTVSSG